MAEVKTAESIVKTAIADSIALNQEMLAAQVPLVLRLSSLIVETFQRGGRVFLLGNGGSAAEAQHIATEFLVHFKHQRRALPVIALTTDTSVLTAAGNDFDFDQIFVRQVEALVGSDDILVALSTSGASTNVLKAVQMARQRGATTVGFTGSRKGALAEMADIPVEVPSGDTQRIQEAHLLLWHIICELVDNAIAEEEAR